MAAGFCGCEGGLALVTPCDPMVLGEGLYRTDLFHRSPLFAVHPPGRYPARPALLVRSWEEALALHGRPTIAPPEWAGSGATCLWWCPECGAN